MAGIIGQAVFEGFDSKGQLLRTNLENEELTMIDMVFPTHICFAAPPMLCTISKRDGFVASSAA